METKEKVNDTQKLNATAREIAKVLGPLFVDASPDEWNRLCREKRVTYDADGRAVGVKEDGNA